MYFHERSTTTERPISSTESRLTIRLFNTFDVEKNGVPMPRTRTRKEQWLLAVLVLRHHQAVDRAWLAGTLWPASPEAQALNNLRRSLSNLRQVLQGEASRLFAPTPRTVSFDLSGADCDVVEFDAALAKGDVAALESAIALYRGPLLKGHKEDWLLAEREAREQNYVNALETLAAWEKESSNAEKAVRYLRLAVETNPFRETAQRALMEALAQCGDMTSVTLVYRQFRLLLHSELRMEPAPETVALYQQLRNQARSHPQAGVENATRGELVGAAINHIPRPLSGIIGRESDTQQLTSRLKTTRLIVLTGTGGVGKTRLAIAVAQKVVTNFPDGVWFIDLASLSDKTLVAQTAAACLGVDGSPGRSVLQTLTEFLTTKKLLLILDNCEHLLGAAAQLAETLLQNCPELHIVATSRQAPGITGEVVWRLSSLSLPVEQNRVEQNNRVKSDPESSVIPLNGLMQYSAIRLFVERAMEASQHFTLTAENAPAVVQICRRLDGIPLALELAAARVKVLSAEQIASRLGRAFLLLTGGSRTALPRQQTLQALIDWSYHLLTEPEKRLLQRLSVFAGGWTLEAAEAVCTGQTIPQEDVLNLLSALIEKSMVLAEEGPEAAVRYRLLETIRQYAQEKAQKAGEEEAASRQHLIFFLSFAEAADKGMEGADQAAWLNRLEIENDNLRAALAWSLVEKDEDSDGEMPAEAGLRLAGALQQFWWTRGYLEEGRSWFAKVLDGRDAQSASKAQSNAINGAGVLAWMQGDYVAARSCFEENLLLRRRLGNSRAVASTLVNLAHIASEQSDHETAYRFYNESLTLFRELDEKRGLAAVLNSLGLLLQERADYLAGRALQEESLALRRELGDKRGVASVLHNLGIIARCQSDYAAARALQEESLKICQELQDKRGIAYPLFDLGTIAQEQGDYPLAQKSHEESLAMVRELGDRWATAHILDQMGLAALERSDVPMARVLLAESLELCHALGNRELTASTLSNLGMTALLQGDYEKAGALLTESLEIHRTAGDKSGMIVALYRLGRLYCTMQEDRAHTSLMEALALCQEIGAKRMLASTLEALAQWAQQRADSVRAARLCGAAESVRKEIGAPLPYSDREAYDQTVARIRASLQEGAFATAWNDGATLTPAQAIACALAPGGLRPVFPSEE